MRLRLTLPPPALGGNHERGHQGVMRYDARTGQMKPGVKTFIRKEASTYRARVAAIAFVAMRQGGWVPPKAVRIDIEYFNVQLDRDNCMKAVNDALAKARIWDASDYWILSGDTTHFWDDGAPRIEVVITAVNRKDFDRRTAPRK